MQYVPHRKLNILRLVVHLDDRGFQTTPWPPTFNPTRPHVAPHAMAIVYVLISQGTIQNDRRVFGSSKGSLAHPSPRQTTHCGYTLPIGQPWKAGGKILRANCVQQLNFANGKVYSTLFVAKKQLAEEKQPSLSVTNCSCSRTRFVRISSRITPTPRPPAQRDKGATTGSTHSRNPTGT